MTLVPAVAVLAQVPVHPPEVLQACGDPPSHLCRAVLSVTGSEVAATASDVVVAKPLKVALIVLVAWILTRLVRRAIKRFVDGFDDPALRRTLGRVRELGPGSGLLAPAGVSQRAGQRARTIAAVLRSVSTATIWTIAGLMVLAEFGVNLGPLIAGAGIVGVALGFGAQSLVKDFLSGIFMLLEDQFGVGDIIDSGEASGVVEGVSLRTTRLRDVEGTLWHVPNGQILRVGNKSQEWSRALLDVQVAYDTDVGTAIRVIKEVADEVWRDPDLAHSVLEEPEVWGVEVMGPDGITIRLVLKTRPADQWTVLRELRRRLKVALDAAGVEIPFPQRMMWVAPQGGARPDVAGGPPPAS